MGGVVSLCSSWESLLWGCGFQHHFCWGFSLSCSSSGSERENKIQIAVYRGSSQGCLQWEAPGLFLQNCGLSLPVLFFFGAPQKPLSTEQLLLVQVVPSRKTGMILMRTQWITPPALPIPQLKVCNDLWELLSSVFCTPVCPWLHLENAWRKRWMRHGGPLFAACVGHWGCLVLKAQIWPWGEFGNLQI